MIVICKCRLIAVAIEKFIKERRQVKIAYRSSFINEKVIKRTRIEHFLQTSE